MASPPFSFGILSRTSFEQMMRGVFPLLPSDGAPGASPRDSSPLASGGFDVSEATSRDTPPPPLAPEDSNRKRCAATTLESTQCKNWAKPSLSYCYTHRGLSETKNVECPICLEKFTASEEPFLLACAHQLHTHCMDQLRTDTCPVCRSRLTNLPKDLCTQIHSRKLQDRTERNEEELQDALHRLGNGINVFFRPFFLPSGEERARGFGPRMVTYPSSLSLTDIFEDFVVRQNSLLE